MGWEQRQARIFKAKLLHMTRSAPCRGAPGALHACAEACNAIVPMESHPLVMNIKFLLVHHGADAALPSNFP